MRKAKYRAGFTLVETVIVMCIAVAIIGGVMSMSGKPNVQAASNQAIDELFSIVSNVRGFYGGQAIPTVDTCTNSLSGAKQLATATYPTMFPVGMLNAASTEAYNPWHGLVTVYLCNTPTEVVVRMTRVPQKACVSMLLSTAALGPSVSLRQIGVNGGSLVNYSSSPIGFAANGALSIANAETLCGKSSTVGSVDWYFKLAE